MTTRPVFWFVLGILRFIATFSFMLDQTKWAPCRKILHVNPYQINSCSVLFCH
jgi:hypothetical protein